MTDTKVLLIDPHQLSREGLRLLLVGAAFDVVGTARSLDDARATIAQGLRPDLVLMALGRPDESRHVPALHQIRAEFADFKFVIIATEAPSSLLAQCIEAGVSACLLQDMSAAVLTQSLRVVMLGQQIFPTPAASPPERSNRAAYDSRQTAGHSGSSRSLSGREGEILGTLMRGHSNKMIARELNIAEATVKVHLKALLRKLNARNRTQAAIWAIANGYSANASAPALTAVAAAA
jgi:two-component system nitrate/nitrite response regulator NarL